MDALVLLLWDVDHTLIDNGGVSKMNYALAFEILAGRPASERARTDGRTDVEIMENLLSDNGVDPALHPPEAQWEALAEAGRRNRPLLEQRGHALAGAEATLMHLANESNVIQSALTGNIEPNAVVKLAAFGLDRWINFSVGGFGTESRVRADLVPVAQRKAAAVFGFNPSRDITVLVGDTDRDVAAGLGGGSRVIAVATGGQSVGQLHAAGADAVLPDLADLEAFIVALATVCEMGPAAPQPV